MTLTSSDIFSTIPTRDHLSLFERDSLNSKRVVGLLDFSKEDVSKATGIAVTSIRYDSRIPAEVHERIREWANLLNLVAEHFKGDDQKTTWWFTTPNPLLGNVTPRDMIRFGRYKKLFKFIINALAENKP